jgi:phosphoribosylformylglycinamidine synthase subunit PurL
VVFFGSRLTAFRKRAEKFETPIISGNVSFYNETDGRGVLPTPTIGMVGLIEDVRKLITQGFKNEGDIIALLGDDERRSRGERIRADCSRLSRPDELIENGEVPELDLDLEKRVQDVCLKLNDECLINSAHDCADGGLAVAIAEQCFASLNNEANGAEIELSHDKNLSPESLLFGESPSRIIITFAPDDLEKVKEIVNDCPFEVIGKVTGKDINIKVNGKSKIDSKVSELQEVWKTSLEKLLSR